MFRLRAIAGAFCLVLTIAGVAWSQAADDPAVARAKQVFDLLEHDKVDEVATQFNTQMAAAIGTALPVCGSRLGSRRQRPPHRPHRAFLREAVTVGAGESALSGPLSKPAGLVAAAIVLVHGSGPNDRDETVGPHKPFRDLAWGLAERGASVRRTHACLPGHNGRQPHAARSHRASPLEVGRWPT